MTHKTTLLAAFAAVILMVAPVQVFAQATATQQGSGSATVQEGSGTAVQEAGSATQEAGSATAQEEMTFRAPTDADGPLKWNFQSGQEFNVSMTQGNEMEMDLGGQKMKTVNTSVHEMVMAVGEVDEAGAASVTSTYSRMTMSADSPQPGGSFDWDSNEEADGQTAEMMETIMKPMIGVPMEQTIAANGEVTGVVIPDEMLSGVESVPGMEAMFSKETVENIARQSFLAFPEGELQQGITWTRDQNITIGPAKVSMTTEFVYKGVVDVEGTPMHVIMGDVSMDFPDGMMGMEVEIGNENSVLTAWFDGNAGHIVKTSMDQNMDMVIAAGGQEISQTLNQKVEVNFTRTK